MDIEPQVVNLPIEDILPNRFQPRLNFEDDGLKELADSIKEHGIIQPLVVRRLGEKYEIIAGERRYKASKMAGLTSVPAIVANLDDNKSAQVAIVENVQRRNLSAIEEAKSYQALLDKEYLTRDELAKKIGLSQSAISNKLRLLSLPSEIQDALSLGKISERHARSLLVVKNREDQIKLLNEILDKRLTVKELDRKIKNEFESRPLEEIDIEIPSRPISINNTNDNEVQASPKVAEDGIEMLDFDFDVNTFENKTTSDVSTNVKNVDDIIDKMVIDVKNAGRVALVSKEYKDGKLIYHIDVE